MNSHEIAERLLQYNRIAGHPAGCQCKPCLGARAWVRAKNWKVALPFPKGSWGEEDFTNARQLITKRK